MKYSLRFIVSYVQPVTQHFGSRIAPLQSTHTERNGAVHPNIYYRLKSEVSTDYASLSAMFNRLHSSTNQELFEKHLCNQNSHYEKYGRFPLRGGATTKSTLFAVSKDAWDTKEDTGKSMKNALYVLQYAKRHQSGRSDIEQ